MNWMMWRWIRVVYTYGRLIKFSHTVFALPFALSSTLLAHREEPLSIHKLFWIIVAMVSARSAAMGFNRWADRVYDSINPRTASRPSVTGDISPQSLMAFITVSCSMFICSAYMLNKLCFILSLPALLVLLSYSYAKRFTQWCHIWLGCAIGLAPLGAWVAVKGDLTWHIVPLAIALMAYISGFDILYACQDIDFDKRSGIYSLPAIVGVSTALRISSILHGITFFSLLLVGKIFSLELFYFACIGVIGVLLIVEHCLVSPDDLTRVPIAFFHVNSAVSVLLFIAVFVDLILRRAI